MSLEDSLPIAPAFTNARMNKAYDAYIKHFKTDEELCFFGMKITNNTAEIFEKLVENAILSNQRITNDAFAELTPGVPRAGNNIVY